MAKREVCRKCKLFYEGDTCPACASSSKTSTWQGRLYVVDVAKSMIAEKISIKMKGEYAIKVR
ncbi:MAG TPA: transcription elongation factor subunit Spt4 [Candidatus Nanoarchaeia archaeon]|nr:transcription elongation factor subunit Spt4 [Candidatus Nanoarchaeia archaeon]